MAISLPTIRILPTYVHNIQYQVGDTLLASPGLGSFPTAIVNYQWVWFETGTPIPNQTSALYIIQSTDIGHQLSCKITSGATILYTPATPTIISLFLGTLNISQLLAAIPSPPGQLAFCIDSTSLNPVVSQSAVTGGGNTSVASYTFYNGSSWLWL